MANAETIYVANSDEGGANGTYQNAHSVTWLNTAGNWANPKSSGKVGPGDTVMLTNVAGTAISSRWITWASGDAGNPITITFAANAKMSAPVWTATVGAISLNGQNYITIDGGGTGIIECTDNGDNLGNQTDLIYGVWNNGGHDITIKNLIVRDMYVRSSGTNQTGGGCWGIYLLGNGNNKSNINVWNCTVHDAATGIIAEYGPGWTGYEIATNTVYNVNHGIVFADRTSASTLASSSAHHNIIYNFTNWDDTSINNSFHHNAIYSWSVQGGTSELTSLDVYGNQFGPGLGGVHQTSLAFTQGKVANYRFYNNLLRCSAGEYAANSLATLSSSTVGSTFSVVGNTIITGNTNGVALSFGTEGSGTMTAYHTNNIYQSGGVGSSVFQSTSATVTLTSDYNLYYGFPTNGWGKSTTTTYAGMSFPTWQGLGYDAHGLTNNPTLNGSYQPDYNSPATGAGVLLGSPYNVDAAGAVRLSPTTIGWLNGLISAVHPVAVAGRVTTSGRVVVR